MEKRIALVGVVSLVLLAASGLVCQNARPSLPDAPQVQVADQAQRFDVFEKAWPRTFGAMGGDKNSKTEGGFATFDKPFNRKDSNTVFSKYLYPLPLKQQPGYHFSSSESLMGRATYAASRIFVTRDGTGKGRLNTLYFLRALTSVAADTASRPYWRRSATGPFSNFGSTVGNDAGMNLWHEFRPNLQQMMKSHAPAFVSKIEKRIGHN